MTAPIFTNNNVVVMLPHTWHSSPSLVVCETVDELFNLAWTRMLHHHSGDVLVSTLRAKLDQLEQGE